VPLKKKKKWNERSLYRAGSLMRVAKEISRKKKDLKKYKFEPSNKSISDFQCKKCARTYGHNVSVYEHKHEK
jgi:transposase-like protein